MSGGRGELVRLLCISPGRESATILIPFEVVLFALLSIAMARSFLEMHQRNHRSWPAIVERMSLDNRPAWRRAANAEPERCVSISIKSPRDAFRDAGVLMEMADYAEQSGNAFDPGRLQAIRVTAIQLRFAAAGAIMMDARFR